MVRVRYSFSSRRTKKLDNIDKQRARFPAVVKEVIDVSDIILEVLDARFIKETRNIEVEKYIHSLGKIIIFVLNKSDLIDVEKVKEELTLKPYAFVSCAKRDGGAKLRNLIKRIVKQIELPDKKERAQVGIIGYPNTGKSSLINLLSGRSCARTGNEAGFTKGMQKIRLTTGILILDTPGVIPDNEYSMSDKKKIAEHTKVGAKSLSKVRNPDLVVQSLIDDYKNKLETHYDVKSEDNSEIFLENVAIKKGYLKKGGVADTDRAARQVLKDWQDGVVRIK